MNLHKYSLLLGSVVLLTCGCTFFEEPATDLRDLTSPTTGSFEPAAQPATATTPTAKPTVKPTTGISSPSVAGTSFLVIAPIEDLPENSTSIGVVHFTRKDTKRAVALCKALSSSMQIINAEDLPAAATNVVLWPVANDNAGGSCIEMLSDYEPIEITVEAAKRVNDTKEGPFLLTRHMSTGKRLTYDLSFVASTALESAIGEWKSIIGSTPADWPAYRRAR